VPKPISAGTVLYRLRDGTAQVLLVHPSGRYNKNSPWGIPKGLPNPGESLEAAARRETREETGVEAGELRDIGYIDYKRTRKRVHAFAGEAPADAAPRCASWEVDGAEFIDIDRAAALIHPDQRPLLERAGLLPPQAG
jgi:predicted NUDIX family NTP pyrophosphohydrolase